MPLNRYVRQNRGPYLFDRWQWPERIPTLLGSLLLELSISDGEPPPDEAMAAVAEELATFSKTDGDLLLDLIYGHYRYAEENGWLKFWGVRRKLSRKQVLSQVESVELTVTRGNDGQPYGAVFVNPRWEFVEAKIQIADLGRRVRATHHFSPSRPLAPSAFRPGVRSPPSAHPPRRRLG